MVPPIAKPAEILRLTSYAALPGWDKDELRDAWPAFLASCEVMVNKADWREPCTIAREVDASDGKAVRTFFESFFAPYQVFNPDGSETGLATDRIVSIRCWVSAEDDEIQAVNHGPLGAVSARGPFQLSEPALELIVIQ